MKRLDCISIVSSPILLVPIVLALSLFAGCSLLHRGAKPSAGASRPPVLELPAETLVPASVHISYANPHDTLKNFEVTEYDGAQVIANRPDPNGEAAIVLFDGGFPVWRFHAAPVPGSPEWLLGTSKYHITHVEYGRLPPGYVQDTPESGRVAPLDPGNYYVYEITRASGATSWMATKVNRDASLQVYEASPRAGTSFRLCCDVAEEFAHLAPNRLPQQPKVVVNPANRGFQAEP